MSQPVFDAAPLSEAIDVATARWLEEFPRDGLVSTRLDLALPVLDALRRERWPAGALFIEWGSGFGGVTQIASALGWTGFGIERQRRLVDESSLLAARFKSPARFAWGNFVPREAESLGDHSEYDWWSDALPDGYDAIDHDLDEFDIFYAYPWPGEEELIDTLFLTYAANGSTLVTHHGCSGFRTIEKVAQGEAKTLAWS